MARGINSVVVAGNIGGSINFGATNGGEQACSFLLAVEGKGRAATWVLVNVYGGLVSICRDRASKGGYPIVAGQLMNRTGHQSQNDLVEIRCEEVVFTDEREGAHNGKQEVERADG